MAIIFSSIAEAVKDENAEILLISAAIESEIAVMESFEDRQLFLRRYGLV